MDAFFLDTDIKESDIPVHLVTDQTMGDVLKTLTEEQRAWVLTSGYEPDPGSHIVLPAPSGAAGAVLFATGEDKNGHEDPLLFGALPLLLPRGRYRLAETSQAAFLALAWTMGSYQFARYVKAAPRPVLAVPPSAELERSLNIAQGMYLARDLVNTPANDMGPAELEAAARKLGKAHGASLSVIEGDDLLAQNLPLVHAVGKSSPRAPRLIDMLWGKPDAPKITLVGKGVCFDSGGLDLKPSGPMALMKKDMGGAAAVLGLAGMVMRAKLPFRLRVLIPAVENAVSGEAFRPGDIYPSRKGLSVEIGNTDAEGRLILADALALGDEENPDLLISLATLTGAARVALGPDLPPFYTHDEALAHKIEDFAATSADPVWRMPLWAPYDNWLKSTIADVNHITAQPFAGSVTAALFLNRFVERRTSYAHFDIFGWIPEARAARPKGGEAQAIRAIFGLLEGRA